MTGAVRRSRSCLGLHMVASCQCGRVLLRRALALLAGTNAFIPLRFPLSRPLDGGNNPPFLRFRDASWGVAYYTISILDTLRALAKAKKANFFDFSDFDCEEYEHYERVQNGDFNWLVPSKFLAFCGPHAQTRLDSGYPIHAPEAYFAYFRLHHLTNVIRLNKKLYDGQR